jgi:hypothetical protein
MDGKQEAVDPNVAGVQHKLGKRSKAAASKYGVDTTRRDYGEVDWLTELQEELMDAAVYIEALLSNVSRAIEADMRKRKGRQF